MKFLGLVEAQFLALYFLEVSILCSQKTGLVKVLSAVNKGSFSPCPCKQGCFCFLFCFEESPSVLRRTRDFMVTLRRGAIERLREVVLLWPYGAENYEPIPLAAPELYFEMLGDSGTTPAVPGKSGVAGNLTWIWHM